MEQEQFAEWIKLPESPNAPELVGEKDPRTITIEVDEGVAFRVLETPGHTPESICVEVVDPGVSPGFGLVGPVWMISVVVCFYLLLPFVALLSVPLNLGLLDPVDVARRAERAYTEGAAPLSSVEGFVRQVIGWREYVWGHYWQLMPDYRHANELGAQRPLPPVFMTGRGR